MILQEIRGIFNSEWKNDFRRGIFVLYSQEKQTPIIGFSHNWSLKI